MTLSTTVDATYGDDPANASQKQHQQDHDVIHKAVNGLSAASFPADFGVLGNGTDETTAIQAMLNGSVNKTIYLDPTKTYRADSALTHPGGYIGIRSMGGPHDTVNASGSAGPKLDLRYAGYRLQCLQAGVLNVEGVQFVNGGTSAGTFILCTLATPQIRGNVFIGRSGVTGATCDEDAVQLGGTALTTSAGSLTSAFGGYGGWVEKNSHSHMRRMVYLRSQANSVNVRGNYADGFCGAAASGATSAAAIELDPTTTANCNAHGNHIVGNLIETSHYVYGVALRGNASKNTVGPNGFWDAGPGVTVADVRIDATPTLNTIVPAGWSDSPAYIDDGSNGRNMVAASQPRVFVASTNLTSSTTASFTTVFTTTGVMASSKSMLVSLSGFSSCTTGGAAAIFQIGNGTTNMPAGSVIPNSGGSHATAVVFTNLTIGTFYTFTVQVEVSAGTWNCRAASFPANEQMIVTVHEAF